MFLRQPKSRTMSTRSVRRFSRKFSIHDRKKLGAAVSMAKPENASQIRRLAENMDRFVSWNGTEPVYEYSQPEMEPTMSM